MNATRTSKRRRNTQPTLDYLDVRIAPAGVTAAALVAELKVEGRQVQRWEAALATAKPGSREQHFLLNHINRTEQRMGRQDVRLAQVEARVLARSASPMYRIKGQPPSNNPPSPVIMPYSVAAPIAVTNLTGSTNSTTASTGKTISTGTTTSDPPSAPTSGSQSGTDSSSSSSLPPNAAAVLDVIYDAYTQSPSDFAANLPSTDGANRVVIQGTNVGIQVSDNNPADFNTLVSQLQAAGMQITTSSATYGLVVGMVPIAQLPAVAGLSDTPSVTALYQPILR